MITVYCTYHKSGCFTMFRKTLTLSVILIVSMLENTSNGQVDYFDWSPVTPTTGTGVASSFGASYEFQQPVEFRSANGADDDDFLQTFGAGSIPRFLLTGTSPTEGSVVFSQGLSAGATLLLLDLDAGESITFDTDTPITFLGQVETRQGENSVAPIWDSLSQTLTGTDGINLEPAALFDIQGVSSISFSYSSPFDTEATIAFGIASVPVDGLPGDVNLDGIVNFFDITAFVGVLTSLFVATR